MKRKYLVVFFKLFQTAKIVPVCVTAMCVRVIRVDMESADGCEETLSYEMGIRNDMKKVEDRKTYQGESERSFGRGQSTTR
jgi:hypothetical protein